MSTKRESNVLSPEEKDFIHRVADLYAPPPLTPTQRTAFDRTLEKRLSRGARASFLRPAAVLATACVAVLVWLTMHRQSVFLPSGEPSPEATIVAQEDAAAGTEETTLLTYAYYNPEFYGEESEEDSEDDEQFLPDEYEALAIALAFPDA
jgi:hypothetical protein